MLCVSVSASVRLCSLHAANWNSTLCGCPQTKLEDTRDALRRKAEAKRAGVEAARKQMAHYSTSLEDATKKKVATLAAIAELQKEIAQKKQEASRAHRRKAQLDSDLKEYKVGVPRPAHACVVVLPLTHAPRVACVTGAAAY